MHGLRVKLAGALLATGSLATVGAYVEAYRRADTAVRLALAGRTDVAVGRISADPFSGRVALHDVVAGSGRTHIRIGTLRLPLPQSGFGLVTSAEAFPMGDSAQPSSPAPTPIPAPAPHAGSGTATADDVVIVDGQTTYRLKHVELAGTSLTNADLAALLDPKSPEPIEARLRKVSATSITIPELDADSTMGATEQHWAQTQILLANVVAGKAALGSIGRSTLAAKSKDNASNIEIGGVQIVGLDMAQVAHVYGGARKDDGETLRPLFDSVIANAIKLTDVKTGNVVTVGSIKEQGLEGRAFKTDLRTQSAALADAKPNDPATTGFLDDLLESTSIQLIEVNDLASVATSGSDAGYTGFGIAKLSAQNVGGGRKIGGVALRTLHFEGGQGKVALTSAEMGTFTFPLPAEATGDKPRLPNLASFGLADLFVDVNTAEKDQPPKRLAFAINHIGYAAPASDTGPIPPKATAAVDHVAFDVRPDDASTETLRSLGYKHVDVSSKAASFYDAANQTFGVDMFSINGVAMGSAQLKLHLSNVSDKIVSPNPAIQRASLVAILFKDIDLVLHNDGLVDKALQYKAAQEGKTVDQERELLTDLVTNQLPVMANNSPKLKPLETALVKFIAAPKTLHVSIATKNGLGAADMPLIADPSALLEQLDIQASAND